MSLKNSRAGLIARSGGVVDTLIGCVAKDHPSLAAPKFAAALHIDSQQCIAGSATASQIYGFTA
jgi:hypothetical protein